jgi:hypothetical protein
MSDPVILQTGTTLIALITGAAVTYGALKIAAALGNTKPEPQVEPPQSDLCCNARAGFSGMIVRTKVGNGLEKTLIAVHINRCVITNWRDESKRYVVEVVLTGAGVTAAHNYIRIKSQCDCIDEIVELCITTMQTHTSFLRYDVNMIANDIRHQIESLSLSSQ